MNSSLQNSPGSASRTVTCISLLSLCAALAAPTPVSAAPSNGDNPCKQTAGITRQACKQSALSDYWLKRAACVNIPSHAERVQCVHDALADLEDAYHDCADQFAARVSLCTRLGSARYYPVIEPANFVQVIDNPLLPLLPGTTFVYNEDTGTGIERVDFTVTHATRQILGVTCTVIHDIASVGGITTEDTFDFFAQDAAGNVWYFGEQSLGYENGVPVSTDGSWEAGVDGASPGLVMKAAPQSGNIYRQEFLIGVAEDVAAVLSVNEAEVVPYGSYTGCIETEDFTPIEPDHLEHKYYAPGIGLILSIDVDTGARAELIDITTN